MMKRKRKLLCLLLFGLLLLGLGACGRAETKNKKKIRVGITLYDQYDTFLSEFMRFFEEAASRQRAEGYEINIEIYDAATSQRTQNEQVAEMIQNGCDILCVNLVDRTAPTEIIDSAKRKDIPVIFFNRELVEEDLLQWNRLYYVGADATESGVMQGELAAEDILGACTDGISAYDKNRDGAIQYIVLEGEAGHQDAIVRSEYCVNTLIAAGVRVDKLGYAIGNWNRAEAQTKMTRLYQELGDSIELIFANNDDMALGAIDTYREQGVPSARRPLIYGIDGTKVGRAAVRDGMMAGTVYNDARGQAEQMFALCFRLGIGEELGDLPLRDGKYIRLPYEKIRMNNVEEYE